MFKTWWLVVIFAIFSINQYFHTCVSGPAQVTVQSRVWRPPWPYFLLCKELRLSAPLLFHLQTDDILVREASHYQVLGGGMGCLFWVFQDLKQKSYKGSNIKRDHTTEPSVGRAGRLPHSDCVSGFSKSPYVAGCSSLLCVKQRCKNNIDSYETGALEKKIKTVKNPYFAGCASLLII